MPFSPNEVTDEPEFSLPPFPVVPEGLSHREHLRSHPKQWISAIEQIVDAYNHLQKALAQSQEYNAALSAEVAKAQQATNQARIRLQESESAANQLQQQIYQLQDEAQALRRSRFGGPSPKRSAKFPDVPVFKGEKEMVNSFIYNLKAKLSSNADWFPTEKSKLDYAFVRLDGKASAQVLPQLSAPPESQNAIDTIEKFIKCIEYQFGASDEIRALYTPSITPLS